MAIGGVGSSSGRRCLRNGDWRGLPLEDLIIYELHVGTFTPERTFDAIIHRLDGLARIGVNALEIMPVAQFPGPRTWGYDGVYPYAVQMLKHYHIDGLRLDATHHTFDTCDPCIHVYRGGAAGKRGEPSKATALDERPQASRGWNGVCRNLRQLLSQPEDTAKQEQMRVPRPPGARTFFTPPLPPEIIGEAASPTAAHAMLWFSGDREEPALITQ